MKLVSNVAERQEKAVTLGAIYGFGNAEFIRPETKHGLSDVLQRNGSVQEGNSISIVQLLKVA